MYQEKAARAGALWDDALKGISGVTHKWKWEYMDYLEDIKYRDTVDVTLEAAKEEIMSYEEFADLKEKEKAMREQLSETVKIHVDTMDEVQAVVVTENVDTESVKTEEVASEVVADVPEVIDYSKLTIEERAAILPVPTDDYQSEYDAYCQRMGYTAEKIKSIRYKMAVYDEFLEEHQYRKKHYGVRHDFRRVDISEKQRGAR